MVDLLMGNQLYKEPMTQIAAPVSAALQDQNWAREPSAPLPLIFIPHAPYIPVPLKQVCSEAQVCRGLYIQFPF